MHFFGAEFAKKKDPNQNVVLEPSTSCKNFGPNPDRLETTIKTALSFASFKIGLKTYLFKAAFL